MAGLTTMMYAMATNVDVPPRMSFRMVETLSRAEATWDESPKRHKTGFARNARRSVGVSPATAGRPRLAGVSGIQAQDAFIRGHPRRARRHAGCRRGRPHYACVAVVKGSTPPESTP